jgi:hypothetical protein
VSSGNARTHAHRMSTRCKRRQTHTHAHAWMGRRER